MFKRPTDPEEHLHLYALPATALLGALAAGQAMGVPEVTTRAVHLSRSKGPFTRFLDHVSRSPLGAVPAHLTSGPQRAGQCNAKRRCTGTLIGSRSILPIAWSALRSLGIALAQVTSMAYLASAGLCIGSIGCLSHQTTARTGNALGLIGVSTGIAATLGGMAGDAAVLGQVMGALPPRQSLRLIDVNLDGVERFHITFLPGPCFHGSGGALASKQRHARLAQGSVF